MTRWLTSFLLGGATVLAGCGCGSAPDRPVKVAGQVLLDGQPMVEGEISFIQEGEPPISLAIANGRFEGQVKPGKRRVEIRRYEIYQPPPMDGIPLSPSKQNNLPSIYNNTSKLSAEVQTQGGIDFKFEIKSK